MVDAAEEALAAQGKPLFESAGCSSCHSGSGLTDSGRTSVGNTDVLLHDVGTCVTTGDSVDVPHNTLEGRSRAACLFDTPELRGLVDSAPYLHDGSSLTLADAVDAMLRGTHKTLSPGDENALVAYLRRL